MESSALAARSSRRREHALTAAVIVVLTLLVIFGLRGRSDAGILGEPAPDFDLVLLDGQQVALSEWRGQAVVLHFWASWCEVCRDEAGVLEDVWQAYRGRGVIVLGVPVQDIHAKVSRFVDGAGLTYPNGIDRSGRIARAYRITGVPESFIISPDGTVANHFVGAVSRAVLSAALDDVLAE